MTSKPNPYVGPRSFTTGEQLFGRDREVNELLDLLIAERIVLLYSPSGAGKTSLVQAALIPAMRADGFQVREMMRVSLPDTENISGRNRYVMSCLRSLESSNGSGPPAGTSLSDYLGETTENELLIFDQFEEILTVDPVNRDAKEEFFAQVGGVLRCRNYWAIFSMREDFVGALDPYVRPIPTRFANTYRLNLLDADEALLAMQQPAERAGLPFAADAARKLVDDLRRVRVQQPDGSTSEQLGPYIEPVQLQVVCRRVWEQLPEEAAEIGAADVENIGDVDAALSGYYADTIARVAANTGVAQRAIRDWFELRLITGEGIRGQVVQGKDKSEGLDNRAVAQLVDAHLVRSDKRAGATWFELSHDRLIAPVIADNAKWREAHLSPLQRQAALWDDQHRPEGLLFRGKLLSEAQDGAGQEQDLSPAERDFLAECWKADLALRRERRNARLIKALGVVAAIAIVLTALFYFETVRQDGQLQVNQKELADARLQLRKDVKLVIAPLAAQALVSPASLKGYLSTATEVLKSAGFRPGKPALNRLRTAVSLYEPFLKGRADMVPPDQWDNLCRRGSILGQPGEVAPACDQAVQQSNNNPHALVSRAIDRALLKNLDGAASDLEQAGRGQPGIENWIQALHAGRNPFTPDVVSELARR